MEGKELREILKKRNISVTELAEKLNISQPNLSNQFRVHDVKSGFLERICDALGVKMDFFYAGSQYLDKSDPSNDIPLQVDQQVESQSEKEKNQEITFLKGQVQALKDLNESFMRNSMYANQQINYQKKDA